MAYKGNFDWYMVVRVVAILPFPLCISILCGNPRVQLLHERKQRPLSRIGVQFQFRRQDRSSAPIDRTPGRRAE